MRIFIAVLVWLAEVHWRIATAVTLRGDFPRSRQNSLLEVGVTRWESTADSVSDKKAPSSNAKLELSDLKDNVDFHMNHLSDALKEKLSNAMEVVDPAEMERLKEACDKVENKIRELQATIKSKCDDLEESVNDQTGAHKNAEIYDAVEAAKQRLKIFVDDGIKEIEEQLNKLSVEFAIPESENSNKTHEGETHVDSDGNQDKGHEDDTTGDEGTTETSNAQKPVRNSLVQLSGDNTDKVSGRRLTKRQKSNDITNSGEHRRKQQVHSGGSQRRVPKPKASEGSKDEAITGATNDGIKRQSNILKAKKQSSNKINGEANGIKDDERSHAAQESQATDDETGKTALEQARMERNDALVESDNTPMAQGKDGEKNINQRKPEASENTVAATTTPNSETEQTSKLAKVPPTAITRTVEQYLQTLNSEAEKLISDIQSGLLHRTKTY
ncbi:signal peptide containing protein, putative [Babesia ovata]|uniref:Signal peptide containing protein, putative n=1 Tax=Babesia ovata TaxID=189622 RepID=A0A2H6KBZ2_9APIC|nr:signal peptide containing protein, putative [Babesia ovata]GBE60511.1 signal peptide containing protein, putative [Babesia ovata]